MAPEEIAKAFVEKYYGKPPEISEDAYLQWLGVAYAAIVYTLGREYEQDLKEA